MNSKGAIDNRNTFLFFTFSAVILLVLPDLLRQGMFMDGVQYACVSRNLAEGKGSFWLPFLSAAWEKQGVNYFLEHLPLVYYLQSKFFVLCNGGFLSERLYCLTMLALSIYFIYKVWKLFFNGNEKTQNLWWLPVLLWISIPSVPWSYKNNMQENTLSVFVLAAIFFALKSVEARRGLIFIILSGLCVFLAVLSKGLPGFFPVIVMILHRIIFKKLSFITTIFYTLILFTIPLLIFFIIYYSNKDAKYALDFYLSERLLDRITNHHEVSNRFTILWWVFTDLLVPIAISILVLTVLKWKRIISSNDNSDRKGILFFALIALAGIVPLTFTFVQRAVYFVPAMPFGAMAFAVFLSKGFTNGVEKIQEGGNSFKVVRICAIVIFTGSIIITAFLFGKVGRDKEVINEAKLVSEKVGTGRIIGTSYKLYYKWDFQFYLQRYYHITLQPLQGEYEYKLLEKGNAKDTEDYNRIDDVGNELTLYGRKN